MDSMRAHLDAIVAIATQGREGRVAHWRRQTRHLLFLLIGLALAIGLFVGLFTRGRLESAYAAFRTPSTYSDAAPKRSSNPSSTCAPPSPPSAMESSPATRKPVSR